jgi:uncharacterized heparinase superfamily protein
MTLTLGERVTLVRLRADRRRRRVLASALTSPVLRWRYGAPVADQLLFVPQTLRTLDPSFASELGLGHFGLAGAPRVIGEGSPFDLAPPSEAWTRALHGFTWLGDLAAAGHQQAHDAAVGLTLEWSRRYRARSGIPWQAPVVARRLISWINAASFLLEGIGESTYDAITGALGDQIQYLRGAWRGAPAGWPRLECLIALAYADLVVAGRNRKHAVLEQELVAELDRQILADGGHVSRNAAILVEILLDLLPLRTCFAARDRRPPEPIDLAVRRILPMLRFMRMGDGGLARFNGVGAPRREDLATVLGYDDPMSELPPAAPHAGYARLERGDTIVLADVGPPPPLEHAGGAHAGCLSFEMSAGRALLFVNAGAPGPGEAEHSASARATASHNTLCLASRSSARLVRHPGFAGMLGGHPIRGPGGVEATIAARNGAILLEAHHDGYQERHRLLHRRHLELSGDGSTLAGIDRLGAQRGQLRLARDLPFAIHFHLHPSVRVQRDGGARGVLLTLADGAAWRFEAGGAELSLEESRHFAVHAGTAASLQIVLRGATAGDSEVRWQAKRLTSSGRDDGAVSVAAPA